MSGEWRWIDLINVFAIVLSPILAVLASVWLQNRLEKRRNRFNILRTLISERHHFINEESVRAYNSIDLLFHDCPKVRQQFREYFDLTLQKGREAEYGKRNLELLKAIAIELGYKNSIDALDLDRVYLPKGITDARVKGQAINEALLNLFKTGIIPQVAAENTSKASEVQISQTKDR